jgi:hypothetical protein
MMVKPSVPIPKFASIVQHRLRTSESKDTSKLLILVWLWFRSPRDENRGKH